MDASQRGSGDLERLHLQALLDGADGSVQRALRKAEGLRMVAGDRGLLQAGEHVAEVRLEPNEHVQVSLRVPTPASRLQAVESIQAMPGNLRYALTEGGAALLADTQLDGQLHLSQSFREICDGLRQTRDAATPARRPPPAPLKKDQVREVVQQLEWKEDQVVEQEEGWELRPRLRGEAVPVQVRMEQEGLRLFRVVLRRVPCAGEAAAEPVADQTLRFNARLRHVRLAVRDGRLVAETRLHSGLVRAAWLSTAAFAVAVAARHVETVFRILAGQPTVAGTYSAMFCSTGEQATSDDDVDV
jgi:hypothetical protein